MNDHSPPIYDQSDMLADDMRQVMTEFPDLCCLGMRVRRSPFGAAQDIEFQRQRDHLLDGPSLEAFARARQWWRLWRKTAKPNIDGTSKGLLAAAAHLVGPCDHGTFIAAGVAEGFTLSRDLGTSAVWFAVSSNAWKG